MDREGFRNRLKQYKEAKGFDPLLKYWEWKQKYDSAPQSDSMPSQPQPDLPTVAPQPLDDRAHRWDNEHYVDPVNTVFDADRHRSWKEPALKTFGKGRVKFTYHDFMKPADVKHMKFLQSIGRLGNTLKGVSIFGEVVQNLFPSEEAELIEDLRVKMDKQNKLLTGLEDIPKYDEGTDGARDNTYVAPIEKELVFIPATGATKLKLDILNKLTRNGQIKSGAIDIVSPEFDLLTGVRAIATLPSKAEKLGRVLLNSDIATPQISIQPNNIIYQSPIKEKVKTISYGKAKTLASDFATGSPYENIMGKVVSVDRGPWKSKIGVNGDQFGKYIGNGSESTVFMANDDPNFVYKILTENVPTPLDAKDYLSIIYSNRNKVPAALQHKLIGFVKNGKGFNPVMRLKRVSVLDQKDNKTLLEKALPQIDKKMNRSGYNRYADTQYFNDKNNIDIFDIRPENVGQLENGNYALLDFMYGLRAEQIPIKSIVSDIFSKW